MKKLLIAILLFTGLASKGQTDTKVYGHWVYQFLKVDSSYRGPQDTLVSAPVGATAVIGSVLYVKLSTGYWNAITGAGGNGVWGYITGSLPAQTDLATKFGTKYDTTVRKMDTLYAITDSTFGFTINGQFRTFKARGAIPTFNGRDGAIILTQADVDSALGYVPSDLPNVANSLQVINNGNTTSWQTGVYSARPAPGNFGSYYTATDSLAIYFDNGITWLSISKSAVSVPSVFGRTGAVTAQTGDYTPSQVGLANVLNSLQIVNIQGTPSASSDSLANRPAAGTIGRLFVSIDTKEIYRDNGSSWDKVGSGASGGVTTYATLTDVNLTSLINGQIAQYNSGTGKWVNITPTSSLVGLGSVPNVDATNAANISSGILPVARIGAASIDLTTKVTGLLPDANIASAVAWNAKVSDSGFAVLYAPLSGVPLAKTTPSGTQRFIIYDTSLYNLGAIATRGSVNKVRDSLGVLLGGKQATGNYITALTSDISAAGPGSAAATVKGIQGIAVSATAPTINQILQYNGSQYAPSTLPISDSGISMIQAILSGVPMSLTPTLPRFIKWDTTEGSNPAAIVTMANVQKRVDSLLAVMNAATTITVNRGLHPVGSNRFVLGDLAGTQWDSAIYLNGSNANKFELDSIQNELQINFTGDATGDIMYRNSSGYENRLGIGSTNQVLTVTSGIPSWQNAATGFTNPMTTGGDLILGGSGGAATRLGIGANTYVLTSNGTTAAWAAPASGGLSSFTSPNSTINIGGSLTAPTVDINLSEPNLWAANQTFNGVSLLFNSNGASTIGNGTNNALSVNTHQLQSNGSLSENVGNASNYSLHVNLVPVDSIASSGQHIWQQYTSASAFPVTAIGQIVYNSSGGMGTAPVGGGLTRQTFTTGTNLTITAPGTIAVINYSSTQATDTVTLPVGAVDQQEVDVETGNAITSGFEVVSLVLQTQGSQTIIDDNIPSNLEWGGHFGYRYSSTLAAWIRKQ